MNELSLRATYGYQGNVVENTGPDLIAYIPSGAAGISRPTGEYLLKIKSLPNPTLRWEKNRNINLGVDFVFWKNKISGSFEYYYEKGTDIKSGSSIGKWSCFNADEWRLDGKLWMGIKS